MVLFYHFCLRANKCIHKDLRKWTNDQSCKYCNIWTQDSPYMYDPPQDLPVHDFHYLLTASVLPVWYSHMWNDLKRIINHANWRLAFIFVVFGENFALYCILLIAANILLVYLLLMAAKYACKLMFITGVIFQYVVILNAASIICRCTACCHS